jgi:hypothetical protein
MPAIAVGNGHKPVAKTWFQSILEMVVGIFRRLRHFSFAYSALAALRMGMSGSASFQSVRKS